MKKLEATCIREERLVFKKIFEFPDETSDENIDRGIDEDVGNTDDDPTWQIVDAKTLCLTVDWKRVQ